MSNILVVEDDPAIRTLVSEILLDEGHVVDGVGDGQAALDAIEHGPLPDLVVLDVRMPVLDGRRFAQRLAERRLALPVLVMTAARNAEEVAREIGAVGCITKPFGVEHFLAGVRAALAVASASPDTRDGSP